VLGLCHYQGGKCFLPNAGACANHLLDNTSFVLEANDALGVAESCMDVQDWRVIYLSLGRVYANLYPKSG
jgi:hypothetical protein